jgi:hypothetical protein
MSSPSLSKDVVLRARLLMSCGLSSHSIPSFERFQNGIAYQALPLLSTAVGAEVTRNTYAMGSLGARLVQGYTLTCAWNFD